MVKTSRSSKRISRRAALRRAREGMAKPPEISFPDILHRPNYPLVISGYTVTSHLGDYYKKSTKRLVNSLIEFDMPHIIYPLQGVDDWCKGCSLKPTLIQYTIQQFGRPVLWIDADGEIFKYPSIFDNANFDIALHSQSGHWLSGTLYVSHVALDFINQWREQTPNNVPDEISLLRLFTNSDHNLRLEMLPDEYNRIVHTESDTSDLIVGHYIRADIAPSRGVEAVDI